MSTQNPAVQTNVQTIDLDIDSLFNGAPGADSIITPTENETSEFKKPSVFSKPGVNLDFLNNPAELATEENVEDDATKDNSTVSRETEQVKYKDDESLEDLLHVDAEEEQAAVGRPKIDKSGLVDTMSKLIEEGLIIPFDDEKPMDEYSIKDWKELLEANFQEREHQVRQETPQQFFESLPEELQYAAKYVADGGTDLKGLFKALAQSEEIRELDPESDQDQELIVRNYLLATGFGDDSEIDEEITTWKDLGKLEQQAKKFKPKLDAMQEQVIAERLARQEQMRQQQQEAAEVYIDNVYHALKTAEINGLKLDKKTQAQLYTGLVQPQYPSVNGRPTNLLGHLLERYQFVEPNYPLIAEALWLLSNPDDYRANLIKQGKNQAVEQTVRQLKTEQSKKIASSSEESMDTRQNTQTRKIPRATNIFKR